jgi:hypothetical protein
VTFFLSSWWAGAGAAARTRRWGSPAPAVLDGGGRCGLWIRQGLGRIWGLHGGGSSFRRQRRPDWGAGAASAGKRLVSAACLWQPPAWRGLRRRRWCIVEPAWWRGGGAWGPLVLAVLSGGARAISGLSEFFHGWSRRRSDCSDLLSRGLLMVGGGVGGGGSLSGSGTRDLPQPD